MIKTATKQLLLGRYRRLLRSPAGFRFYHTCYERNRLPAALRNRLVIAKIYLEGLEYEALEDFGSNREALEAVLLECIRRMVVLVQHQLQEAVFKALFIDERGNDTVPLPKSALPSGTFDLLVIHP